MADDERAEAARRAAAADPSTAPEALPQTVEDFELPAEFKGLLG